MVGLVGIEPTTNWLWANCSNPWATGLYNRKKMEEGKGFEPSESVTQLSPLAGEPFQPLRHPSNFLFKWRKNRDSNPGYRKVQRFSRPSLSTTQPFFQNFLNKKLKLNGSPTWIRTRDQMINSHLLYRWATEENIYLSKRDFITILDKVKLFL